VNIPSTRNDDQILADMLAQAEALCQGADALMAGQYRFLAERIRAVMELRECHGLSDGAGEGTAL
jgi:hypothetical protein